MNPRTCRLTRGTTTLLARAGMAALLGCAPALAAAEDIADYPSRPVRFIVPYATGGLPDTVARVIGQRLTESLGKSFVVENKPGANGVVAAQTLMGSPRDGYTFLVTDGSMMSINPSLYKDLAYEPKRDFVPVSLVATSPLFIAARPDFPANTLKEFVELAKKTPTGFTYGSSGVGSSHHLTMEAMKSALNLRLDHVPFRGSGQAVPALVGKQVDLVVAALPSLSGFAQKGQAKILATNSLKRSSLAPDIPAVSEIIPDFNFAVTVGVLAPAGTPDAIVQKVSAEVAKAVKKPEVIKQLQGLGIEPVGGSAEEYARAIDDEARRYAVPIKAAGIKAEN
ncbi:MAG: tripartite tricarboxylate transporter substrate binding protein [Pigmentiphaga sp.]|uniref:Bug family tripartite tricarboxylate transporter substrate binding protein n=1 Tax=Pigmentiphaga sp. TaxID=1977564 RepID=UPI0029B0BEE3|nr:tripartite tricarboxylate transporter substrate binding protein [Pigmentiphaga sp.]MDX3907027.1 tripartite tricarboxylate transporter substrate binding protein [Pigmentiphaga sp.]